MNLTTLVAWATADDQKKFKMTLLAMVLAWFSKFVLQIDDQTIGLLIIGPAMAFVIGQGIADTGKEAAKIENAKPTTTVEQTVNVTDDKGKNVEITSTKTGDV